MTEYLLTETNLKRLSDRLRNHRRLLLFLDYDGTLAPFRKIPSRAAPLPGIKPLLRILKYKAGLQLCLISGRSIADLKKMLYLSGIYYAGLHGLEITAPDSSSVSLPGDLVEAGSETELRNHLQSCSDRLSEFEIENKGPVITIHHPPGINPDRLALALRREVDREKMEVLKGRQIVEIRPRGWNKGRAVQFLIDRAQKEDSQPYLVIYIGDDSTDEDAFRQLKERKSACTVYVKNEGNLKTEARYYLNGPEGVKTILKIIKGLF